MAVDQEYLERVQGLLSPIDGLEYRDMFGGFGVYAGAVPLGGGRAPSPRTKRSRRDCQSGRSRGHRRNHGGISCHDSRNGAPATRRGQNRRPHGPTSQIIAIKKGASPVG